ncbi:Integrase family protein (fragment) [Frankia canadensis]|uniref:Integrase family protein n=2 Tax=Frankia canadensis TaxID=1836972 RepID=A0A2I2KY12_9ACTN
MRCHVLPQWGDWPLIAIGYLDVQGWVTRLSERLAPQTVVACFRLLYSAMKAAVRARLVAINPCEGVSLPARRARGSVDAPITRAELVGKVLPALPERYRALVLTAAYAGLRWGECAGLRWAQVDLDARRLVVIETVVEVSGRLARKLYPKSEAGRRTVPLPPVLVTHLRRHAELVPAGADDLVFPDSGGDFLRRSNFRRHVWVPARAAADSLTFHGLRHCYATWLITEGVPVNVVQVALGHERASTTLDRYTHRPRDYEDRLRDALTDSADDSLTGDDREG